MNTEHFIFKLDTNHECKLVPHHRLTELLLWQSVPWIACAAHLMINIGTQSGHTYHMNTLTHFSSQSQPRVGFMVFMDQPASNSQPIYKVIFILTSLFPVFSVVFL